MASLFFDFLGLGGLVSSFIPQDNPAFQIVNGVLNPIGFIVGASMGTNQLKQPTDWNKWIGQSVEILGVGLVSMAFIRALT